MQCEHGGIGRPNQAGHWPVNPASTAEAVTWPADPPRTSLLALTPRTQPLTAAEAFAQPHNVAEASVRYGFNTRSLGPAEVRFHIARHVHMFLFVNWDVADWDMYTAYLPGRAGAGPAGGAEPAPPDPVYV
jgi:hypothetical protein